MESFQAHAIADTFHTIQEMEKTRTKYRAVLNWMKDVSKQLDPENLSLMDKHRKVGKSSVFSSFFFRKLNMSNLKMKVLVSAFNFDFSYAEITL